MTRERKSLLKKLLFLIVVIWTAAMLIVQWPTLRTLHIIIEPVAEVDSFACSHIVREVDLTYGYVGKIEDWHCLNITIRRELKLYKR